MWVGMRLKTMLRRTVVRAMMHYRASRAPSTFSRPHSCSSVSGMSLSSTERPPVENVREMTSSNGRDWACNVCTFLNAKPYALLCEVCEHPRDGDAPSVGADNPVEPNPSQTNTPLPSRAQLEKERLARVAVKRVQKHTEASDIAAASKSSAKRARIASPAQPRSPSHPNSLIQYPHGTIKLTAIQPYPRLDETVSFVDVVRPRHIRKCFMSGFQFDIPWVASNLPPHIPVCLALHNSIPTPPKIQGNIHLVFPKVGATYSTMHVKLYVLYYDSCVRVVISSANLVDYDWNALENIVFCQDFALKEYVGTSSKEEIALPDRAASSPLGDVFKQDLIALLKEMEVAEWVWQGLDPFDFSPCRAQLIVSRPGKHTGKDVDKYGLGRLSMVVKDACPDLATAETTDLRMMYATSSLGSLATKWLQDVEAACCGRLFNTACPADPSIQVVFPTIETVEKSHLGRDGAGTITWSRNLWSACAHKTLLRDCVSKRPGALSHCKVLVCERPEILAQAGRTGIYYCGSHNMTMSAWGKPSVVGKKKERRLEVNNWEVGVAFEVSERLDGRGVVIPFLTEPLAHHGEGRRSAHLL